MPATVSDAKAATYRAAVLQAQLDELYRIPREAVRQLRQDGWSYRKTGRHLGMTPQTAHKIGQTHDSAPPSRKGWRGA